MYNTTHRKNTEFLRSHLPIIVIEIVVTALASLVNLAFFIVCFKTLKNKFHNLLVLSLCFSNFFLGLSIINLSLTSMTSFFNKHVNFCVFQVFAIFFGLVMTYSILFVLCLERYLIVQSRNFGINQFLNRFKYVFLAITLGVDFMFTFEVVIFFPHAASIDRCSARNLLESNYLSFVEVAAVSLSALFIGIVCITIRTCFLIWKIFFEKKKVVCYHGNSALTDSTVSELSTSLHQPHPKQTTSEDIQSKRKLENNLESVIDLNKPEFQDEVMSLQFDEDETNTTKQKILNLIQTMRHERQIEGIIPSSRHNKYKSKNSRKTGMKFDSWEIRAFISSLIIAITTIGLTFPFAFTFWYDIFSTSPMSNQIKFFFIFPVILHLLINPFIFAWLVPEINKELKKLLKLQN